MESEEKGNIRYNWQGSHCIVNPAAGDVYFMRMLLHHDHSKGKNSFEDMKTVKGELKESYQEVCRVLGLLQDDQEWDEALHEGALTHMPCSLRELFVTSYFLSTSKSKRSF